MARVRTGTTHGAEEAPVGRIPIPTAPFLHAVGEAVHGRLMAALGHTPRVRIDGTPRDVLPTGHPADTGRQLVRPRQTDTTPVEEASAAIGRATKPGLRPRPTTDDPRRVVVVANGPPERLQAVPATLRRPAPTSGSPTALGIVVRRLLITLGMAAELGVP